MATKKKSTVKKPAAKKAPAKKASAKKAMKGKRYTPEEKSEILAFVEAQGRGGQSQAAKKFGVSALTISNWRKAGGGSAAKATTKAKATATAQVKVSSDPWKQMVELKKDIDIMEAKVAKKKAVFSKLAASL